MESESKPKLQRKTRSVTERPTTKQRETNENSSSYYDLPRDVPVLLKDKTKQKPFDTLHMESRRYSSNESTESLNVKLTQIDLNEQNMQVIKVASIEPLAVAQDPLGLASFKPESADETFKKPKLPPKTVLSKMPTRPKDEYSYCTLMMQNHAHEPNRVLDSDDDYERQQDQDFFTVDSCVDDIDASTITAYIVTDNTVTNEDFEANVYAIKSLETCADCNQPCPKWISMFYLITVCDDCVTKHLSLLNGSLEKYKFTTISDLKQKHQCTDLNVILYLLKKAGNEKLNSLLEYNLASGPQPLTPSSSSSSNDNMSFIRDKYIDLKYINKCDNLNADLNAQLYEIINDNGLTLTIYNLILGANLNFINFADNMTVLDNAIHTGQYAQAYYLHMNGAKRLGYLKNYENFLLTNQTELHGSMFEQYSFGAMCSTIPVTVNVDLNKIELKTFVRIDFKSIIRVNIVDNGSSSLVEIKWCLEENQSIISTYLTIPGNQSHTADIQNLIRLMAKNLLINTLTFKSNKMRKRDLVSVFDMIDTRLDMVRICGFLQNELNETLYVLVIRSTRDNFIFKRSLVFLNMHTFCLVTVDLRRVESITMTDCLLQMHIKLNGSSALYVFKSRGYSDNLDFWYASLTSLADLTSDMLSRPCNININYLNNENIPLVIEKCLMFMQLNGIGLMAVPVTSLVDHNDKHDLIWNLRASKSYSLNTLDRTACLSIPNTFHKYINDSNLRFKVIFDKMSALYANHTPLDEATCIEQFKAYFGTLTTTARSTNSVDFAIFKYFLAFVLINHVYLDKSLRDLCEFLFNVELTGTTGNLIKFLLKNFQHLFKFNNTGFLTKQIDYLNKHKHATSMDKGMWAAAKVNSYLNTIYVHDSQQKSFQMNISMQSKNCQVLNESCRHFGLKESKYWCLSEVYDGVDQSRTSQLPLHTHLERLLPINMNFYDSSSKWFSSYYLCVKLNRIQIDLDKCENEHLPLKKGSLENKCDISLLTTLPTITVQGKYKNCLICIRSLNVCVYKNIESIDTNQTLVNFSIENCLFYIGYVAAWPQVVHANNVLTVYNSTSKQLICVSFSESIDTCRWYLSLFKLKYFNDFWSLHTTSDYLPDVEYTRSLPSSPSIKSNKSNNRRSSEIARMVLSKIIKK